MGAGSAGSVLVIPFMKRLFTGDTAPAVGHLEAMVMRILWEQGEINVREVAEKLDRPLAYTTVMTTLDRLFKKGFLDRRRRDRAYFYIPRFTRDEWERRKADDLVAGFLGGLQPSGELLISCLVDAVGEHDETLLDELERKIKLKREELSRNSTASREEDENRGHTETRELC
jgi:predicted transcriptional regulator